MVCRRLGSFLIDSKQRSLAFVLNYAAYFAEIFRGGIQSIPQGQYEAAQVLQLSPFQTVTKIVIPQVTKIVLPSVGNEVINLVKDSSLIYILGLGDVMRARKLLWTRRDFTAFAKAWQSSILH